MMDENFSFNGSMPVDASISNNISKALAYQSTHTEYETLLWFKSMVDYGSPWDYKIQPDPNGNKVYQDFGNFNYAVVGTALKDGTDVTLIIMLQRQS